MQWHRQSAFSEYVILNVLALSDEWRVAPTPEGTEQRFDQKSNVQARPVAREVESQGADG